MIFSNKATRHWRLAAAGAVAAAATAVLVACGGGTSQSEPFIAERVLVFGDDASALTSDGRRYGINGLASTGTPPPIDCNLEPIWVQGVAGLYGFVFAECNTATPPPEPKAFNFAAPGATVADVAAQVDAQVAAGGFRDKDLVLTMAGMNDVLELYAQYPTRSEESLIAESRARGERMAMIVNRMISLGARVVVSNLPDMGMSPYARAEALAHAATGFDRSQLITRLTTVFNEQLGVKVLLDGRFVGLAQLDLRTQGASRSPLSFGFTDVSTGFCAVAPPNCTTATPVTAGAISTQYLWADATRLSTGGQNMLSALAQERALRNPF
ncbi:MAG: SGNH/GDSL hydrolase family protein [Rubrivivax sp.]|nr:SGNH/GDSL hydrolase family protein [Rubrivivax sp.]